MMKFNFEGKAYVVKNEDRIEFNEDGNYQATVIDIDGNEHEMIFNGNTNTDIELTDSDILSVE